MKDIVQVFFLSLLLYIRVVTGNGPAPVIGHVHGSVLLPYSLSVPVIEVIWDFSFNGRKEKMAEFRNEVCSITGKAFQGRLQWSDNGATLMITDLTMEDTGIYTANIYDIEHTRHEISYNLIVFKLVPRPDIKWEMKKNEDGRCDYTLHCSVPLHSPDLSYSWKLRDKNSEYHHFAHGNSILISSPNDTWEFLCLVQNPAHENSFTLVLPTCPVIRTPGTIERMMGIAILTVCLAGIVATVMRAARMRRQDKENKKKEDIVNNDNDEVPRTYQWIHIPYSNPQSFPPIRTGQVWSNYNVTNSYSWQ